MLHAITAFRLTTADPDRLAAFYQALGFTPGARQPIPPDELAVLGLAGLPAGSTRTPLTLGASGQRLELDRFTGPLAPYPPDATGADSVSRHPALVTADIQAAWTVALAAGARPVSVDGPVQLPAAAGGVIAAKFRDPDGHPLEFLQFPAGSAGARKWGPAVGLGTGSGTRPTPPVIGIDHLAMAVLDTTAAEIFFTSLGLMVDAPGLNHGPTQAAMDGLADPRVAVVPIKVGGEHGGAGANLELLGYQTPRGRDLGPVAPTDVASLRTVWAADRDALLRDPSGHLHLLWRT